MAKISVMFGNELQAEYNLELDEHKIGRAADCEILVDNMGVSRHHCSIVKEGENWVLVDKGSNNGSFIGGQRVTKHVLKDQDNIVLGKHTLVYDAYGYATEAQKKRAGSLGSEMTMFVDPKQMQKMQEDLKKSGGPMVLSLMQGGREIRCQLTKPETIIGKGALADIPIKGFLVKPIQAKVTKVDTVHRIVSTGGFRGVKVNGAKVKDHMLQEGDIISIAGTILTYKRQ